jgi:hypothetical protein
MVRADLPRAIPIQDLPEPLSEVLEVRQVASMLDEAGDN